MTFWKGQFRTPCNETAPKDTFLKLKGWRKGIAYINGINLGKDYYMMDGTLDFAYYYWGRILNSNNAAQTHSIFVKH